MSRTVSSRARAHGHRSAALLAAVGTRSCVRREFLRWTAPEATPRAGESVAAAISAQDACDLLFAIHLVNVPPARARSGARLAGFAAQPGLMNRGLSRALEIPEIRIGAFRSYRSAQVVQWLMGLNWR